MEVIGVGGHRGKGKGFHNNFEWGGEVAVLLISKIQNYSWFSISNPPHMFTFIFFHFE